MNPAFARLLETLCTDTRNAVANLVREGVSLDRLRADDGYQMLSSVCNRYEELRDAQDRRDRKRRNSRADEKAAAAMKDYGLPDLPF